MVIIHELLTTSKYSWKFLVYESNMVTRTIPDGWNLFHDPPRYKSTITMILSRFVRYITRSKRTDRGNVHLAKSITSFQKKHT